MFSRKGSRHEGYIGYQIGKEYMMSFKIFNLFKGRIDDE